MDNCENCGMRVTDEMDWIGRGGHVFCSFKCAFAFEKRSAE